MMGRNEWMAAIVLALATTLGGCARPVVWYCRAYNTPNNTQYAVDYAGDRGWSRAYKALRLHVDLRVSNEVPTPERLRDVDLLIILNPEADSWEGGPRPRLMTDEEIGVMVAYVMKGGSILFASNQDWKHNIEKPHSNRLLENFGVRVGREDVGLKILPVPDRSPVVGGLTWRFFFGSPLEVIADSPTRPHVWVWNDPDAETLEGERGRRVPLMAASSLGWGRVVVLGDAGWTANGTIGMNDNWPILWRLIRWLTRSDWRLPPLLAPWPPPAEPPVAGNP